VHKIMVGIVFIVLGSPRILAQTSAATADHLPRGTATDVTASEISAATLKSTTGAALFKVVPVNKGEYNIGVAVLNRESTSTNYEEHSKISEIYYIISGDATLVTGGTIEDMKPEAPSPKLGPSWSGAHIRNGVSREVHPGDVVVIPPNTPHGFTNFKSDKVAYLSVRIDPHHVLSEPGTVSATGANSHH
jgi:mannose-6-phosphate isomerase-like protein (cupin superfamily)